MQPQTYYNISILMYNILYLQFVSIIMRKVLTKHGNADLQTTQYIPMNTVMFQLTGGNKLCN